MSARHKNCGVESWATVMIFLSEVMSEHDKILEWSDEWLLWKIWCRVV